MSGPKQISIGILSGIISMIMLAGIAVGQSYDRSGFAKLDQRFTIGFERQVYTLYKPGSGVQLSKKTKTAEEHCNRIIFRMKLISRFRLETGLSYKAIDRILNNNGKYARCFNVNEHCKLSVPVTIQYQLQNERSRIRPYFGAGVQYNKYDNASTIKDADILTDPILSNRLKYINIIFTQGLIYDITPDLQITQSIHILPENGIKPIGINFGIGYRIK